MKYVDACKVVKGLEAPNGNFMTKDDAHPAVVAAGKEEVKGDKKAEKKDDKPKKKSGVRRAEP